MTHTNTPGPWSHDDGHIFTDEKGREYNSIATVHDIYKNDGTVESNAKLIAAAPDLLQALKALLTDADDRGEIRDDDGELFEDWKNAIVAIEKATGESLGYLEKQTAN